MHKQSCLKYGRQSISQTTLYKLESKQFNMKEQLADANERTKEVGTSTIAQKTCISDAIRQWNIAPELLKNSKSLFQAKREIKNYARGLPI